MKYLLLFLATPLYAQDLNREVQQLAADLEIAAQVIQSEYSGDYSALCAVDVPGVEAPIMSEDIDPEAKSFRGMASAFIHITSTLNQVVDWTNKELTKLSNRVNHLSEQVSRLKPTVEKVYIKPEPFTPKQTPYVPSVPRDPPVLKGRN